MKLRTKPRKGHDYWSVVTSQRSADQPNPREQTLLYLGRLDGRALDDIRNKTQQVRALEDAALSLEFDALLVRLGYPPPLPSLALYDLQTVRSYGPELALCRLAQELDLVTLIDAQSPKGGGPSLGKMTIAMAIYATRRPSSYSRFPEWYRRSPLPLFMELPPPSVTYDTALNTLDYLQPVRTRPIEAETYARVRRIFHYSCERIDIDSTVVELEGTLCRFLAKFGRGKNSKVSTRRQILITFMVDQKGALVGHEVFPGNKNDGTTLTAVDRRLREEYDGEVQNAARVVDRGYASLAKVRGMKRRKDRFIAALRAGPNRLKLLAAIGARHEKWAEIDNGVRAASVIQNGLKWVVTWNDEVAERTDDGRKDKLRQAKDALKSLQKAVATGKIKSRAQRDQKAGAILRRYGVTRFLHVKGVRKGFGFTVESTGKAKEQGNGDGYQVFVTTELNMTDKEVFGAYRARDRIEKAIRILKSVLGLGPVYVSTKEHVLGHVYVHALAYQLRSALQLRLREKGMEMSAEEALWELERLQVAELVVKGGEITAIRKLTRVEGITRTLAQVFSLVDEEGLPV